MTDEIVNAETENGELAGKAIVEAVENQIRDDEPPETRQTLERLISLGETRKNAIRYIASVLIVEISDAMKNQNPYNESRYIKNLKALPKLPY